MKKHTITLEGPEARGERVLLNALSALSDALIGSMQRSLRLRVEGRSNLHAKAAWLDTATRIELTGLRSGSTILEVEVPTLREAAPELFEQLPLWSASPHEDNTALTLFEDALEEAVEGNADSELLDRNVLSSIAGFGRLFDLGFDGLSFDGSEAGSRRVRITPERLQVVRRLRQEVPSSKRVIITGRLDELRAESRTFRLRLSGGQALRGVLPPADPNSYGPLFDTRVVVDGEATFRPSGAVSIVTATSIQAASPDDAVWDRLPRAAPRSIDELKPRNPIPRGTNGMENVFGKWPGSETDEEIRSALAAIE